MTNFNATYDVSQVAFHEVLQASTTALLLGYALMLSATLPTMVTNNLSWNVQQKMKTTTTYALNIE